jgi:hypothetical protein
MRMMNKEELYRILDMDSPEDFRYFENIAELFESDEDIDADVIYQLVNERELHPIVNVEPYYESVYKELEKLVLHPESIAEQKRQSYEFVRQHHHYIKVAQRYQNLYISLLNEDSKENTPV